MDIDTSLLREKFVIEEQNTQNKKRVFKTTAMSNRMVLHLQAGTLTKESFVLRTNTMHSCTRLSSSMIGYYEQHGSIMLRENDIKWGEMWEDVQSDFDRRYNKDSWCAIYYKGKPIFSKGKYHTFFDVIEHCDFVGNSTYYKSIPIAEKAFAKAGKDIAIEHDSNIAMVTVGGKDGGRCSMLMRGADHSSTFHLSLSPKPHETLHVSQLFDSSACFLEGTQLCYIIGDVTERIEQGLIQKYSDDATKAKHAVEQLRTLEIYIDSMERRHRVRYRPERPNFELLIAASERETRELLYNMDESGYID